MTERWITCSVCGASFPAMRRDAKTCSTACRVAAHRLRKKAEREHHESYRPGIFERIKRALTEE